MKGLVKDLIRLVYPDLGDNDISNLAVYLTAGIIVIGSVLTIYFQVNP